MSPRKSQSGSRRQRPSSPRTRSRRARDRLTDVKIRDSSQNLLDHYEYKYDAANNVVERTINGNVTSYAYNVANELCWRYTGATSNGCANPPAGAVSYQFDSNGNELGNDAGLVLNYNAKDQTIRHKDEDATSPVDVTFLGFNQLERIRAGAVTFQNSVLGISRRTDSTGQAVYFTRSETGSLIGARPASSGKYYYLGDGVGSVAALTNASGQIVRHYKYDPYGNLTLNSPSPGAPIDFFRFLGAYNGSAGHYHFEYRFYDPRTARWTQPDPIEHGADLKQGNRYAYVGGNPVNRIDQLGLHSTSSRIANFGAGTLTGAAGVGFGFAAAVTWEGCTAVADEAECIHVSAPFVSFSGASFTLSSQLFGNAFHRHYRASPPGDYSPCGLGTFCNA
jgi:RHS repeat-associated protein